MEVHTGDTFRTTEQETTCTGLADGSWKRIANKAGLNQLSFKRALLEVVAQDAKNLYELPEKLAKYVNKYRCIFVSDQGLKDTILTDNSSLKY